MASILLPVPVDLAKAREAVKAVPLVVKVVA